MPPPQTKPAGLPPSPIGQLPIQLPGTTNVPAALPPQPQSGQDTAATESPTNSAPLDFDPNIYQQGLKAETQRLDQAIGHQMRIALVQEGSSDHTMAVSLAKNEQLGGYDPAAQREIGPGGILATGQFAGVGGPQIQVCVVGYDPERAQMAWEAYIAPTIKAGSHPQTGFAWMVAHAVGHCLDAQSRQSELRRKMSWRTQEIAGIGLWPAAVNSVLSSGFGAVYSKDGLMNQAESIYNQPMQRQYSERVADAFSTLWITRLGATQSGIQTLAKIRFDMVGDDAAIRLAAKGRNADRAGQSSRADRLWDMAREVQNTLGVDTTLIKNTSAANAWLQTAGAPSNEVVQWKVTPQGLVGIDAQGREVHKPNTAQQVAPGMNFKDLKRFGQ